MTNPFITSHTKNSVIRAVQSHPREALPQDCAVECYFDPVNRDWTAQYLHKSGKQHGFSARGRTPLGAVQNLRAVNTNVDQPTEDNHE